MRVEIVISFSEKGMRTPEPMGRPRLYWNRKSVSLRLEVKLCDLVTRQSDLESLSRNMLIEKVLAKYVREQDTETKWEEKYGKSGTAPK